MFELILERIKAYSKIVIFRHINPDPDALGSQFGLAELIRINFPDKEVFVEGDFPSKQVRLFKNPVLKQLANYQGCLGIVCDTANQERIDSKVWQSCQELVKIDHHIVVDQYGDINYEDVRASSCCQILGELVETLQLQINENVARSLYIGMITDSNRFMYDSTTASTFKIAAFLLNQDLDLTEIYDTLYTKKAAELNIIKFILNNYQINGDVAYYILQEADLKKLGITRQEGSDYVNTLANVEEYKIWLAITQSIQDNNYRVSIRSRQYPINEVAIKYQGGGHRLAAGATLTDLDQLERLLLDLNKTIK